MSTSAEVRERLIEALELDLVGPNPEDMEHAEEILPKAPSTWYLSGFLVPYEADIQQRVDDAGDDSLDEHDNLRGGDDERSPEPASARKASFPSSMGLSVLVSEQTKSLNVTVQWGDYEPLNDEDEPEAATESSLQTRVAKRWQRIPRLASLTISLSPCLTGAPERFDVPDSNGLQIVVSSRPVQSIQSLPDGTCSVAIFLVNARRPADIHYRDKAFIFQASLTAHSENSFIPRPDPRGNDGDDWDEGVADLQYRNDYEYAVGHNVSVVALVNGEAEDQTCHEVRTVWMPRADVEKVIPTEINGVELSMEALAAAQDAASIRQMLGGLVTEYTQWINKQLAEIPTGNIKRKRIGEDLLRAAERANLRISAGLQALDDPLVFEAFQLANRAIATAIRQRSSQENKKSPASFQPPKWRPFQLAFLVMNMVGIADPLHVDRDVVDLLFFPTGGGKTEAYLGLAAFTLVLRRLRNPGISSAGVSVLMRYTLRLLTMDQLTRASTLICALELERQRQPEKLGPWPFEIGLWVGLSATPNIMGHKGDSKDKTARSKTRKFQRDSRSNASPIPLENCPWCGEKFTTSTFELYPNPDHPIELRIICTNRRKWEDDSLQCYFNGRIKLPIVAVDEPLYRRLPCFVIATVDKFANLPWVGQTGALFGKVTHYKEKEGFYGPVDSPRLGGPLPNASLLPPDLIIQDELHLISGPLGTMVGLYETAIDELCSYSNGDKKVHAKIIASTATVRRAKRQIQGLFGRHQVEIFPAPGPNRRDSFFARTALVTDRNPRTYIGIAAQGRSMKAVMLRTYLALLAAAKKQWDANNGKKNPQNPADPYMTLLGYFNSLRELGGSRRIVEDEVRARIYRYGDQLRVNEISGPFANRKIDDEPCELTSRVGTNKLAETKRRLALEFNQDERVDVVLATNMISVGLDITRLGLMVVLGQPKTAAEYIQATSRVGRDENRPGLVVTLLNMHRPRDRSYYEHFEAWHNSFYRAVEATSVTPFSPRSIDRGIAGVTVALARLMHNSLTAPASAGDITKHRHELEFVADILADRVEAHDVELDASEVSDMRQKIKHRVHDLLDSWEGIARHKGMLQYQREVGTAPPLLHDFLDNQTLTARELKFRAQRSLRDVEPSVCLWVTNLDNPNDFVEEEDS